MNHNETVDRGQPSSSPLQCVNLTDRHHHPLRPKNSSSVVEVSTALPGNANGTTAGADLRGFEGSMLASRRSNQHFDKLHSVYGLESTAAPNAKPEHEGETASINTNPSHENLQHRRKLQPGRVKLEAINHEFSVQKIQDLVSRQLHDQDCQAMLPQGRSRILQQTQPSDEKTSEQTKFPRSRANFAAANSNDYAYEEKRVHALEELAGSSNKKLSH